MPNDLKWVVDVVGQEPWSGAGARDIQITERGELIVRDSEGVIQFAVAPGCWRRVRSERSS